MTATDSKNGTPIVGPHEFGTDVNLPHAFGNDVVLPITTGNPVNWSTPDPAHFGNVIDEQ